MTNSTLAPYKLYYFDGRGRAEVIRWILSYAGVDFEDIRIERPQWKDFKASAPFGQVPYLEIEGELPLAQSHAIGRFLARRHGLVGETPMEEARVDSFVDLAADAKQGLYAWFKAAHMQDKATADTVKEAYLTTQVGSYLSMFEGALRKNQKGEPAYFVGKRISWADLAVVELADELVRLDNNILEGYPLLKDHSMRVHALEGIQKWVAQRPESSF